MNLLALIAVLAQFGYPSAPVANSPVSAVLTNSPVRITVEPVKKTDPNSPATAMRLTGGSRSAALPADLPNTTALYYHVKLANVSARPLTNAAVRWAVLWVDEANQYRVTEKTLPCSIAPVRHFEFDTDPITVRPRDRDKVHLIQKADVVGYLIEVLVADEAVARACKPPQGYDLIQQLRAAKRK